MDPRIEKFFSVLEEKGWNNKGLFDHERKWWIECVYFFESYYHPAGTQLFVTLLIDKEMFGEYCWAIGIGIEPPKDGYNNFFKEFSLNAFGKLDTIVFVKELNGKVLR